MENETKQLYKRSDGFTETSAGDFAVVMIRHSALDQNKNPWFAFRPSFNQDSIRIEWLAEHIVQLFPAAISRTLIAKNYARHPDEKETAWLEDVLAKNAAQSPADDPEGEGKGEEPNPSETAGNKGENGSSEEPKPEPKKPAAEPKPAATKSKATPTKKPKAKPVAASPAKVEPAPAKEATPANPWDKKPDGEAG